MSQAFVTVSVPKFLSSFREEISDLRDEVAEKTAPILRREEEASIRSRWYRLGRTLKSLREEIAHEPSKTVYRLTPTTSWAVFGEFGTGRRGSQTGRPAPKGYTYGDKPGMEARRYSRIAVASATPKVIRAAQNVVSEFGRNVTVR